MTSQRKLSTFPVDLYGGLRQTASSFGKANLAKPLSAVCVLVCVSQWASGSELYPMYTLIQFYMHLNNMRFYWILSHYIALHRIQTCKNKQTNTTCIHRFMHANLLIYIYVDPCMHVTTHITICIRIHAFMHPCMYVYSYIHHKCILHIYTCVHQYITWHGHDITGDTTALHYIALHCIALLCTALYYMHTYTHNITWDEISKHNITLHASMHYIIEYSLTYHYIALYTYHCVALHSIALHYMHTHTTQHHII